MAEKLRQVKLYKDIVQVKAIRNCFQLEYRDKPYELRQAAFGDFIRGTCFLWQVCSQLGIQCQIYLNNHPIHLFLQEFDSDVKITPNSVPNMDVRSWNSFDEIMADAPRRDRLVTLITAKSAPEILSIGTNHFPITDDVPNEFKIYMRQHLTMNNSLKVEYDKFTAGIAPKSYSVIHIRAGDPVEPRDMPPNEMGNIVKILNTIPKDIGPFYIISDNPKLRNQLVDNNRFFKLGDFETVHLAYKTDKHIEGVKNTLLEFFFMSNANKVFQLAPHQYWWGSGFSEWCCKVYDVPIEKYKF